MLAWNSLGGGTVAPVAQGTAGKQATVARRETETHKREYGGVPLPFSGKLLGPSVLILD